MTSLSDHVHAQIYADFAVSHGGNSLGTFRVRLDYDKAPRTCANFIGLATGQRAWVDSTGGVRQGVPYYDGLTFHRLDHTFAIQGGDPSGTGQGGPGYSFLDEFHDDLTHSGRYLLSMGNSETAVGSTEFFAQGLNLNGSQFFITLASNALPELDRKQSVFGEVINDATYPDSRALIDSFTDPSAFPVTNNVPDSPIVIDSVTISGPDLAGFDIHNPALQLPVVEPADANISFDENSQNYSLTWDRKLQSDYYRSTSIDLSTWMNPPLPLATEDNGQILRLASISEQPGWSFTEAKDSQQQLFIRVAEVDYGLMTNAPSDLIANGKILGLVALSGQDLTLVFDGAGGGTWEIAGLNGVMADVSFEDMAPDTGAFDSEMNQGNYLPMGILNCTLVDLQGNSPVLRVVLSFHSPTGGWSANSSFNNQRPFTYIP